MPATLNHAELVPACESGAVLGSPSPVPQPSNPGALLAMRERRRARAEARTAGATTVAATRGSSPARGESRTWYDLGEMAAHWESLLGLAGC